MEKISLLLSFALLTLWISSCQGGYKSDLFLQQNYVIGHPVPVSLEDTDDDPGKAPGAHKVLFGHYTNLVENNPAVTPPPKKNPVNRLRWMKRPKNKTMKPGGRSFGVGLKLLGSALKLPFNSVISSLIKKVKTNIENTLNNAVAVTTGVKPAETEEKEKSCEKQLESCESKYELRIPCGIRCLVSGHPVMSGLVENIASFLESFCLPKNSIFQEIFRYVGKGYEQFRKFKSFLNPFKMARMSLPEIGLNGWESVMSVLIDHVPTDSLPLRLVSGTLNAALGLIKKLQPRVDTVKQNRLCMKIDARPSMITLVDVFKRDTSLLDLLLKGFGTLNLVAKYVKTGFKTIFKAFTTAIKFVTGVGCGLLQFAITGKKVKCDELGGNIIPGMPLPDDNDGDMMENRPECLQNPSMSYGGTPTSSGDETVGNNNIESPPSEKLSRRKRSLPGNQDGGYNYISFGYEDGAGFGKERTKLGDSGKSTNSNGKQKRSLIVGHHYRRRQEVPKEG